MKKAKGYSLIEVLISIFFLAFCVLFIISIFPTATSALVQAENIEIASNLAHRELEALSQTYFPSILSYPNQTYTYNGYKNGVNYTQNFIYRADVSSVSSRLKDVVIKIIWGEHMRLNQSIYAETMVYNNN